MVDSRKLSSHSSIKNSNGMSIDNFNLTQDMSKKTGYGLIFNDYDLSDINFFRSKYPFSKFSNSLFNNSQLVEAIFVGVSFINGKYVNVDVNGCLLLLAKDKDGSPITQNWLAQQGARHYELAITDIASLKTILANSKIEIETAKYYMKELLDILLLLREAESRIKAKAATYLYTHCLSFVDQNNIDLLDSAVGLLSNYILEKTLQEKQTQSVSSSVSNHLVVGDLFASGGFSKVYHGEYNGNRVAIKIPNKEVYYRNELLILKIMQTSCFDLTQYHVIGFHGSGETIHGAGIIFDYAKDGCLKSWIQNSSLPFDLDMKCQVLLDMATAVTFMHACGVIHNDLKPDNVLIIFNGKVTIRLGDFGLATIEGKLPLRKGTVHYQPPSLPAEPVSRQTDIYSLGLCFWEVMHRRMVEIKPSGFNPQQRPEIDKACDTQIANTICSMWHSRPSMRPTAEQCRDQVQKVILANRS